MRQVRFFVLLLAVLVAMASTSTLLQAQETLPTAETEPAPEAVVDPATPSEPDKVYVGVYVNDIQQMDLQTHSYAMDFYVWLRWENPDINPSATLEYMNPFQLWGHMATPIYEEPQDLDDGSKYMAFRYQGQFNSKLPLEKYPFDDQRLIVEFEDNAAGAAKQVFVPDPVNPIKLNPEMTLPGYIFGTPTLTVASKAYPTNFGDTRLTELEPYSRVTFSVPVHRPKLTYAIKVILPVFLVVICAALVFFIHPSFVEGRIGMGITALLTLVALQITSNSQLPEVDYLMMIDMLYFVAYVFVIASLWQVVRTSWTAYREEDARAIRQDRWGFAVFSILYVAATAAVIIYSLSR